MILISFSGNAAEQVPCTPPPLPKKKMPDKKIRLYAAEVKIFLMIRKLDSIAPGHPYNTCPRKPLCHKKNEEKIDFAYRAVLHSGQKMRCVASLGDPWGISVWRALWTLAGISV